MTQLRRLIDCRLDKGTKVKQSNGTFITTYEKVDDYKVTYQEVTDTVSASIYGADINKVSRIDSPHNLLEKYLSSKLVNDEDNISKYTIVIDGIRYSIISVRSQWIDIERLGTSSPQSV